jgi:SAM-dependent methyltransferase
MTAADVQIPPAQRSFRDPAGTLYRFPDRILRAVQPAYAKDLEDFLATTAAREAVEDGRLVRSVPVPPAEYPELGATSLWEHERIPFPSFPYEWAPEMLHAAGSLTLDLAEAALQEGFGLKDATPYNILFRGARPVFVDVLSFERRDPLDSTWMAYAQFVRTFLLPLMANRYFGLPLNQILTGQRDGIEPETMYRWAGFWQRLTPPFLGLVTIPKWMGGSKSGATPAFRRKLGASPEQARFVLSGLLRNCRRQLNSLAPAAAKHSNWSGYLDHKSLYSPAQLAQKEDFVQAALDLARPRTVLDVGANEGRFSVLAARSGSPGSGTSVVAIDSDPAVMGTAWQVSSDQRLDVLPLVVDLTRPTPAVGWRNQECASFLDRARGAGGLDRASRGFDLVMMLAVVHHMLVTERIPLEELLELADELSREYVLIEFVAPQDPMFQRIVRGRDELYSYFSPAWFEAAALSRFELVRSTRIDGLNRWLYLFRRRHATN